MTGVEVIIENFCRRMLLSVFDLGNISWIEGKKISMMIDDAIHYMFCYTLKPQQKILTKIT